MNKSDLFFNVVKFPAKLYYNYLFNINVVKNEMGDYKGPAFFIGNHVAAHDSQISILYSNRMIRMIAAEVNWQSKFKNFIFNILDIIPIVRSKNDTKAVRRMKQTVADGHCVGIYPEAERTWDGKTLPILASTSKLARLLGVPVYCVTTKGLHLSRPRWSLYPRSGKVDVYIEKVLSKEQVQSLKKNDIQTFLEEAMVYNEFEWQKDNMVVFKGKRRAEGIERLLYVCENCEAINAIKSKMDHFSCLKCEKEYTVNKYGFIEGSDRFDNTASWNEWQKSYIDRIIDNGFAFKMKDMKMVILQDEKIGQTVDLQFTQSGFNLYFTGERRYVKIDIKDIEACNAVFKNQLEIFICGVKHNFTFEIGKNHMSIVLFEELLKKLISRKKC